MTCSGQNPSMLSIMSAAFKSHALHASKQWEVALFPSINKVSNLLVQPVSGAAHLADALPQGCCNGRTRAACRLQMLRKTARKGGLHLHRRSAMSDFHLAASNGIKETPVS